MLQGYVKYKREFDCGTVARYDLKGVGGKMHASVA